MKKIRRLGSPMRRPRRRDQEEERIPRTRTSAGTTEPVVRHKIKQGRCPSPCPNPHPGTILLQNKTKRNTGENHRQSEPLVLRAFGLGGGVCRMALYFMFISVVLHPQTNPPTRPCPKPPHLPCRAPRRTRRRTSGCGSQVFLPGQPSPPLLMPGTSD